MKIYTVSQFSIFLVRLKGYYNIRMTETIVNSNGKNDNEKNIHAGNNSAFFMHFVIYRAFFKSKKVYIFDGSWWNNLFRKVHCLVHT